MPVLAPPLQGRGNETWQLAAYLGNRGIEAARGLGLVVHYPLLPPSPAGRGNETWQLAA
jgi:hypothetical protein